MEKYILDFIKQTRKQKKLTQKDLADVLGMKDTSYGDIENGVTKLKLCDFLKLCNFLNIDPVTLLNDSNQIIISVSDEQAELIEELNEKIQRQKQVINIKDNHGTINITQNKK